MTKYKMYEDVDPRAFCLYLGIKNELNGDQTKITRKIYCCSETGDSCVGAVKGFFTGSNDSLNMDIVKRCPARKTIDKALA